MFDEKTTLDRAVAKVAKTARRVRDAIPYRTVDGIFDDMKDSDIAWWTNGFWPGILWLAYRETGDEELAAWATGAELRLDRALEEHLGLHHDVGFMWKLSSVARYAIKGGEDARRRGLHAANLLAGRFNLAGRFLRAWNDDKVGWAIIDCLMNLPLLYWASAQTGDPRFRQIAEAHTETAQKHFLYSDGSSKHIVEFDPNTGAYLRNYGGQGYADGSAWSRGAAWALHGFALGAHFTGRPDFLASASLVADFFLDNLPADGVPFSDFKAPPRENVHKDSSAGSCAASGLLLLSGLCCGEKRGRYADGARRILAGLDATCSGPEGDEALLQHGCTAFHETKPGWRDTSLVYGDYFYLEALIRLRGREGLFQI
ncbi:MAG: glycoside hydrolase family 88 protein [Spirochaetaceae bacterium]|nr:glycoside hydrolase family 88 protein [Spirochaetaceae bacterium]